MKQKSSYLIAAALIFIGAVFFSSKAVLVKLAYRHEVDSVSLLTLRMLFSLPLFLIIGSVYQRRQKTKASEITRQDWMAMILFGACGYYLASLLDFLGLQYISAGLERLVLFVYPTIVILLSALFFRQKITRYHVLALLLTYVGVAIAFAEGVSLSQGSNLWLGALLVFGAAFTYAIYIVGSGSLLPKIGTIRYTAISMSAACLAVIFHHAIGYQFDLFHFAPEVYGLSLLMAVFATVVPSFMITEGIRIVGASNAAIIGSIGPISTIVLAYFFLEEKFGYWQMLGTFLVISGILIISLRKGKNE